MMKSYSSTLSASFIYLTTALLISALVSCDKRMSREIELITKLQEKLDSNHLNLNLDADLFRARAEHIDQTLRTFENHYKNTMSKELGDNLSKFKNFYKIYLRNTSVHDESMKEQVELTSQLQKLMTDLQNGKMTKNEFKMYYRTEKTDVDILIRKSKDLGKLMYEIEPEYLRINEYLEPIADKIGPK